MDSISDVIKVELDLISDICMYLFFEKDMRGGGVSYFSKRYSEANNKYLSSYDPRKETKHIIYLDANNSYGYARSKFLPKGGFKS